MKTATDPFSENPDDCIAWKALALAFVVNVQFLATQMSTVWRPPDENLSRDSFVLRLFL
ncbi:MAG: hypothetical protein ACE361_09830 [Aureliella sp.]